MSDSADIVAGLVAARESFTLAEAACAWVEVPLSLAAPGVKASQWDRYPGKLEVWRFTLNELKQEAAKGPLGSLNLGAPIVRCREVKSGKVLQFNLRTGAGALVDGVRVEYFLDVDPLLASRDELRKFAKSRDLHPRFLFPPEAVDPGAIDGDLDSSDSESEGQPRDPISETRISVLRSLAILQGWTPEAVPADAKGQLRAHVLHTLPKMFTRSTYNKAWAIASARGSLTSVSATAHTKGRATKR